jgi:hypothetical protein
MKFWKLSHDKTMYDFEGMLFFSLKTVFTEILKTRIFKWYFCVYKIVLSWDNFQNFIYGMSFPHNFLFNIKEERHYKFKFMEILFVSICFNYTYFICQKTMMLFTKNILGVKVELVIGGRYTMGRGVKIPWVEFQFSDYCYNVMQNWDSN